MAEEEKGQGAERTEPDGTGRRGMTVSEAGRKGGQKVRELIEGGKSRS